jgi:hypothetical protein
MEEELLSSLFKELEMSDYCYACEDLVYQVWQLTDSSEKVEKFVIEGVHFQRNGRNTRNADKEAKDRLIMEFAKIVGPKRR